MPVAPGFAPLSPGSQTSSILTLTRAAECVGKCR